MADGPAVQHPVVVAGGGWAGLACAFDLCRHDIPVVLVEAARQLGGRARSIRFRDAVVDNGQHVLTGACRSLLGLLEQAGVDVAQSFTRIPLTWHCMSAGATTLQMRVPLLPAPLHLLGALLTARGLAARDRWRALRLGGRLARLEITAAEDFSVRALLHSQAQSPTLIRQFWEPLCVASLNTGIDQASARIFVRVLRETFAGPRRNSDLLIPKVELGNLLPVPCAEYLERKGARIILGKRVTGLDIQGTGIAGVTAGEHRLQASHLVLATPHVISRRLLSGTAALRPLCERLAALRDEPVTTLYIQYPRPVRMPQPITALQGGLAQWIVDRAHSMPGLVAVVVSARGAHMRMSVDALYEAIVTELATAFPGWPAPSERLIIREKRATFCSRVGIDRERPPNRTPVRGLWLAGDYTDNGLPATLEGAVRSGLACAQAIRDAL